MEELQLTLTPARVDQRNFGVMLSNWRAGQVINAVVVDKMPSGNVVLNVGGREFVTPLDLPVQPGNRLQLEIQQVTPQLILKLLSTADKPIASQMTGATMPASDGVKSQLIAQPELRSATLASFLTTLTTQPALSRVISQTPALAQLVRALMGQALKADSLSAGVLAQLIGQSGLFHEANLLAGREDRAKASAKTQLLQLQRLLGSMIDPSVTGEARSALSVLSDLTSSATATLNQQQLSMIPQENQGQRWVISLPLEWTDSFTEVAITIERDHQQEGDEETERPWRVNLQLELPQTGKMSVLLTLVETQLSVLFQSDSVRVRQAVEGAFGDLKTRMILGEFRIKDLATASYPVAEVPPAESSGGFEVTA